MKIKEKINLKRLTSVVKKNSIKIIAILFLFTLFGYFYSYNMITPKYKSTSTILLASNNLNNDQTSLTQSEVTLNKSLISTYGKILKSNNVLKSVIDNLNLNITTEELYESIQIEEIEDTQILQIDVINESASEAQRIAEELNNVFIEEIKQIYKMDNINIVDKASLEQDPYNINHVRDIFIFFVIGNIVSILMVSVIFLFDTTIKIEQDIEEYSGLKVMGTVPEYKGADEEELIVQINSKSVVSEALKTIRTNLSFSKSKNNKKCLLFTSCNSGEGKSWTASNMAVTYAQSNKNVIIIDADMRKGRQHNIFKVQNSNGLSNCLEEIKYNQNFEILEKYIKETNIPKVHIMTIGILPPNPSELLLGNEIKQLIYMLRCVYDVIIIDGTPCNLVSDSIPLSRIADTTILVTESKKTKIEDLNNVVKTIKNAGGNIEGAILNKKEIKNKEYRKGYYYERQEVNSKIDLEYCTVKELIDNRQEYIQTEDVKKIIEKEENNNITELTQKIENLEDKLLEIPNMNLESYTKIVDEIRKVYTNEIDKNKLAEEIKQNVIKNELMKKIEQLNFENNIDELINKMNNIENSINNGETEEKISHMIYEMREEQNIKMKLLGNTEFLQNILEEIREIKEQQDEKIAKLDNNQLLTSIQQEIREVKEQQDEKMARLDNDQLLTSIQQEIREVKEQQDEKIARLDNRQFLISIQQEIEKIKQEQNEQLCNSKMLNNIAIEIQRLNQKYEKVDDIEKAIFNIKIDEHISAMIEQMKQENIKKIEEANNKDQLNTIMEQLQQINKKYNQLVEEIAKNRIDSISDDSNYKNLAKQDGKSSYNKNKIIELNEVKEKLNKQELVINYGDEISYEELLDLAIDTYEISPNKAKAI